MIVMTIQKVTQNISNMKKVRYKGCGFNSDMTFNKVYEVMGEYEDYYTVIDDNEDENAISKHYFEEVKEPNYVMVRQGDCCKWEERILLHDLGEQFSYRYVVVGLGYEHDFINGKEVNCSINFKQMKPINEVERKIEELEQKLAELKQQLNK